MTPALDHVFDEVRGAWRFRWVALITAFIVALIGWAVVFALPDRYEADARVFVDTRTALKPALQGLTIDQNVDAQINYVRQSLAGRSAIGADCQGDRRSAADGDRRAGARQDPHRLERSHRPRRFQRRHSRRRAQYGGHDLQLPLYRWRPSAQPARGRVLAEHLRGADFGRQARRLRTCAAISRDADQGL